MEAAVKNKVGYKKTKLGWIPEDWEEVKLEKIISKFVVPMRDKPRELSGEIPWCRIEDFEGKYLFGSKSRQGVSEQVVKDMNLKVYPEGTLLVSCSANLGKCAIVGNPLVTNQTFIGLVPIVKNVDTELLYYIMISSAGRLNRLSTGTTISYLSREEFEKFNITLPKSLPEQQKIATILSTWDKAIDKLTQLIAAKEQRKKGLMQLLLTGKKRFVGFTEEWKVIKLGGCSVINGDYGINAPGVEFRSDLPKYLRITDIDDSGQLRLESMVSVNSDESHRYILEDQDIVFARTGASVGKNYVHDQAKYGPLVFAGFLIRFRLDQKILLSHFLRAFLTTSDYWNWIKIMSQRSGQPGINGKEYCTLKVPVPTIEEQQKIASTLSAADKEIELLKQELKNLQQQKKGLMQKLLTGEVRVKIKE